MEGSILANGKMIKKNGRGDNPINHRHPEMILCCVIQCSIINVFSKKILTIIKSK